MGGNKKSVNSRRARTAFRKVWKLLTNKFKSEDIKCMRSKAIIDGIEIPTLVEEFEDCNILEVEVGTNGYKGGDSGHGGRTYLRLKDLSCSDLRCKVDGADLGDVDEIEIVLGGDAEMTTFRDAISFASETLEAQTANKRVEVILDNEEIASLLMLIAAAVNGDFGGMNSDKRCRLQKIKDKLNHKYEL